MDVNGKVAIVTGGIRGIGFAIVQYLLRKKAEVNTIETLVAEYVFISLIM